MARYKNKRLRKKRSLVRGARRAPCCHCLREFDFNELTIDHIIPKSRGGSYKLSNLVVACAPCNNDRGDLNFDEFNQFKRKNPDRKFPRVRKPKSVELEISLLELYPAVEPELFAQTR